MEGIATKSFVAATAAAAEANFRVIKWHSQMPAPPIVSWRLPVATQTQLCPSSVATSPGPAAPRLHQLASSQTAAQTSECTWFQRAARLWQLATGGGICGATLVQLKAMANMINWALTLFMRPTPESKPSLSRLSRVSKPSLYSCNALCIFWPCNLKPFLAQRNKVVSCCFARNENANDGNHDQAVGQPRQLCSVQFTPSSASFPWQIRLSCFVVSC